MADWRLSTVPKYLTPEQLQGVLGACNQDKSTGRRDYATLLLLARLGLRAGEVDIGREIPKLATYLGHAHVNATYWYLEAMPELLELATERLVEKRTEVES